MQIQVGRNGSRFGVICAFVKWSGSSEVYMMAPYHVLAGAQRPKKVLVRSIGGESVAEYKRGQPFLKSRGVDVAYARLLDHAEYSNDATGTEVTSIETPNDGSQILVVGGLSGQMTGSVINVGDRITQGDLYSIQTSLPDLQLQSGDSGSPWLDVGGSTLFSMHLGRLSGTSNQYRTIWLSRLQKLHEFELAD